MVPRQLESWLAEIVDSTKIIHLFGLRQTGKTTLMDTFRGRFPKALHYPLYDLVILRRYEGQPERWVLEVEEALTQLPPDERLHIFVDEIQKIPPLFQGIQGLYEKHRQRIKFWIWGSSARPLKRHRAETLAGRCLSRVLWPLSQSELLQRESCIPHFFDPEKLRRHLEVEEPRDYIQKFSSWLQQTMLPEANLMQKLNEAHELLASYQATYLENEIRRENLVNDIGVFERFLSLAASEDTGILNYSAQAKALGITPHTVKSYYGILEDTFVITTIGAYSQSLRVQIRKSPKVCFADTGLARFVAGERGLPVEQGTAFGKCIEGFVINEILKQIEYQGLPWKPSYLRTKTGMEVDLILSQGRERIAIEIKSTNRVASQDLKSLLGLMELDPEVRFGLIVSRQSGPFQLASKIYNVPLWNL